MIKNNKWTFDEINIMNMLYEYLYIFLIKNIIITSKINRRFKINTNYIHTKLN